MIHPMRTIRLTALLSLALTMGLVTMDAAHASSIVYTKGGDVWRSSPDGRHQTRLTRDGGYSPPSQDDRGRVYAVQRGRFARLSRSGRHIGAAFSAAVGQSGNVTAFGPWEPQVSPDGKRIAYWRGIQRLDAPVGGYAPYDLEDQVVISRSDRFTPDSTFGYQRGYRDPTWVEQPRAARLQLRPRCRGGCVLRAEARRRSDLRPVVQRPGRRSDRRRRAVSRRPPAGGRRRGRARPQQHRDLPAEREHAAGRAGARLRVPLEGRRLADRLLRGRPTFVRTPRRREASTCGLGAAQACARGADRSRLGPR